MKKYTTPAFIVEKYEACEMISNSITNEYVPEINGNEGGFGDYN